jgi:glycosyltransferase involved in cell wall biosynthesis
MMGDNNNATFILMVQNNEDTIKQVMEDIIEDFFDDDELIIVLNNSTDTSENKIDPYLAKLPNTKTKIIRANDTEDKVFSIEEALEIGKENSGNDFNFIIYGNAYTPVEWYKDE